MSFSRRSLLALGASAPLAAVRADDIMLDRLNRFNTLMRDFTGKLRGQVFDAKEAALLSKLWRDVEQSGEWPR